MNSPTFVSNSCAGRRADVELLIARAELVDDAAVLRARNRPAARTRCPSCGRRRSSAWPARCARAGCSTACRCGPGLRPRPGRTRLPSSSAAAFFSAMASEPAANTRRILPRSIIASRSSSLSIFRPLKIDQLRVQAAHQRAVELARPRTCPGRRGPSPPARRRWRRRGCRPRGPRGRRRVASFSANSLASLASFGASVGRSAGLAFHSTRSIVVLARVFQHDHAPGAAAAIAGRHRRLDRHRGSRRANRR